MVWIWLLFILFIMVLLALDLGVFHRKTHVIGIKEAMGWSALWVTTSLAFSLLVYFAYENKWYGLGIVPDPVDGLINSGALATEKYLTGYIVEYSLSMDNIFVIAMVFRFFAVPALYQHRVLFWGILGALVMRGVMIGLGAQLIAAFHWVLYLFAAFLILTAIRLLLFKEEYGDLNRNLMIRLARRFFRVTSRYHGEHFIVRAGTPESFEKETPGAKAPLPDEVVKSAPPGSLLLTPLALALVMVETIDVIFAVDSVPAVFAITADPFLVFTSNVFAILGLRSLYFALAGFVRKFRYLKVSLSLVLLVVGLKMLFAGWLRPALGERFNLYILVVIFLILTAGIGFSLFAAKRE